MPNQIAQALDEMQPRRVSETKGPWYTASEPETYNQTERKD